MKIVLIIHHRLDKNAGAPGVVISLADEFRARGHHVTIISHDPLAGIAERFRPLLFPFYCLWNLWRHHRDADVIDASSGTAWMYFLLARHRDRGLYVAHSHGLNHVIHDRIMREVKAGMRKTSWKYPFFNGSLVLWQDAETFRSADLALFLNQSDRRYAIERLGVDASTSRTVKNGLSKTYLEAARKATHRPPGVRTRIVQVGSYLERKGIKTTAAALPPLMFQRSNVELTFLGTGRSEQEVLADFPRELHSRVHVIPSFDNECLPSLLSEQDIFIMPSLSEGFPLAPMEAMACGLVPIVTDIPGPTEYIKNRQNGLLIPLGDAQALTLAIEQLLDNEDLYRSLQTQAILTASSLQWSTIAADRLDLYRQFLKQMSVEGRNSKVAPKRCA